MPDSNFCWIIFATEVLLTYWKLLNKKLPRHSISFLFQLLPSNKGSVLFWEDLLVLKLTVSIFIKPAYFQINYSLAIKRKKISFQLWLLVTNTALIFLSHYHTLQCPNKSFSSKLLIQPKRDCNYHVTNSFQLLIMGYFPQHTKYLTKLLIANVGKPWPNLLWLSV